MTAKNWAIRMGNNRKNTRATISPLQIAIMYFTTAFGSGILTLPRSVGTIAREDMWLSVILGGLAMGFSLWCTVALCRYFPNDTAIEYHSSLLGPIVGQLVNIFYLMSMVLLGAAALRSFSGALNLFLFEATPHWIIQFVFLGVAAYAGQYGVAPLIRMQQFILLAIAPTAILLMSLGFLRVEPKNFQPFLAGGLMPVLKGIVPSWFAYSGPELITGLAFPFVTQKKQVIKAGLLTVAVLAVMYTTYTVIVQGVLGVEEIIVTVYPTIIAYREVNIPDTFVERIDGYMLSLQIVLYFLSLANLLYFSSFGCSRLMKLEYCRPVIILLVPVFYFIAMLPQSVEQLISYSRFTNNFLIAGGLFILPLLLLIAKLRKRGGCS